MEFLLQQKVGLFYSTVFYLFKVSVEIPGDDVISSRSSKLVMVSISNINKELTATAIEFFGKREFAQYFFRAVFLSAITLSRFYFGYYSIQRKGKGASTQLWLHVLVPL